MGTGLDENHATWRFAAVLIYDALTEGIGAKCSL